ELPSGVQIVITDNGCGIHPEDIHHIFKRFYRSRFSKDKQGIGLGLPLAKAIVEAHNGTIEVDSELGIGTTFTMNFLIPTKL
ncbi:MAG: sensor histidine kinase, partial [Blautia wexlerae]